MIYKIFGFAFAAYALALPQATPPNGATPKVIPGTATPNWADIRESLLKAMETKPASVTSIPPTSGYPNAERETIRWGPYTLLAATGRSPIALDAGGNPFFGVLGGICRDCMFLMGKSYITFEDGRAADIADGVYNHHVAVHAQGLKSKVPFKCKLGVPPTITVDGKEVPQGSTSNAPIGSAMGHEEGKHQPFSDPSAILNELSKYPELTKYLQSLMDKASGEISGGLLFGSGDDGAPTDYASKDPSLKAGLYISKEVTIGHYTEITNYKNYPQVVYITADVEYIRGRPPGFRDAFMSAISSTGCGGIGFFPPAAAQQNVKSPPWTVARAGYIYNAHAHLHDGGVNVQLFKNGTLVCTSEAIYGGGQSTATVDGKKWETIQGYEFCTKPVEVSPGDILTLESNYDLRKHQLRPGAVDHAMGAEAMGLLGLSFAAI